MPLLTGYVFITVQDDDEANVARILADLGTGIANEHASRSAGQAVPQSYPHLNGLHSFGDMVDNGISGTSFFAKTQPLLFQKVNEVLRRLCPDAYEVIPPSASRPFDARQQTSIMGRAQGGKTMVTLVLAWLYWHFCDSYSFIGAWRYRSSTQASYRDSS